MQGFGPATYGEGFAEVYDEWYGGITDADATAAFMTARMGSGPLLELGIGSGRLAGPLRAAGLAVIGIDASRSMLDRCRVAHADLPLVQADLAHLPLIGSGPQGSGRGAGGALCAFNTLFNLPTAAAQRDLLHSVAAVLIDDAPVVIEALTGHALADGPPSSVGVSKMSTDRLVLSATVLSAEEQTIQGQHVDISEKGIVLRPWLLRWTTPEQLDALARDAGLVLTERYAGWNDEPFDDQADQHVSVYRRR